MTLDNYQIGLTVVQIIVAGGVGYASAVFKIGQYTQKVKTLEEDNKTTRTELKELLIKVTECSTSLKEREPLGKKRSPVALTERGNKVLTESGGQKFIEDNLNELKEKVELKNPKTSYDVQEYSKVVIEELTTDERINNMKEYLYKEGMELDDLIFVLGIYLRDKVLENKGWKVEDVDKYTPAE